MFICIYSSMDTITLITFVGINFIVSAISDLALNFWSSSFLIKLLPSKIISSLKPYFDSQTKIMSAYYAGLTVAIVLVAQM